MASSAHRSTTLSPHIPKNLAEWFLIQQRPLPWRKNRDPYSIWISETMLQQTTTTAVIPYYERFLIKFPNLTSLAKAPLEEVFELWAGLGYYSRARNLLKAAQLLESAGGFPKSFEELLKFPGFGPYTARAVASLAFGQRVGVLDGNVIRVLSRFHNAPVEWWKTKERAWLQEQVDFWVQKESPQLVNQALMELGATLCTPKNPSCLLCPLQNDCRGLKKGTRLSLPLGKPKRAKEIWSWEPQFVKRKDALAFVKPENLPFLKNHWVLPGPARLLTKKPKTYDFKHNITHHEIYVTLPKKSSKINSSKAKELIWVPIQKIPTVSPTSLVLKALKEWQS